MGIIINQVRENEQDKTVYFTVTDSHENSYKWHGDVPLDVDTQTYLDGKEEEILTLIYKRLYPGARMEPIEGQTKLEAFEEWISKGCINPEVVELDEEGNKFVVSPETIIEKVPWKSTHPSKTITNELLTEFDNAKSFDELKPVLKKILIEGN